jgi:hypothetical protein
MFDSSCWLRSRDYPLRTSIESAATAVFDVSYPFPRELKVPIEGIDVGQHRSSYRKTTLILLKSNWKVSGKRVEAGRSGQIKSILFILNFCNYQSATVYYYEKAVICKLL